MSTKLHIARLTFLPLFLFLIIPSTLFASLSKEVTEYKGKVVNSSGTPLASAYLTVNETNISTVTNNEGMFSLKIPDNLQNVTITVSHLGYQSKTLPLEYFKKEEVVIELLESPEELSEVQIFTYTDPRSVVSNMLKNRENNYFQDRTAMTAFYRETIKRGRRNVSLSEALVTIHKEPYRSAADDDIALVKARKTADYNRLDTLALKLRGGPYNPLSLDIMKNPEYMFGEEGLSNFKFSFDDPSRISDRYLYVINFEELDKSLPWYYGKLFVDAENFVLVKADFSLNVDNRSAASDLFVKKKPGGTKVYPVEVNYKVQYRERNGRWYFGYGITELEFVVNWKRRLFNSRYKVNSELAVTNWKINTEGKVKKDKTFLSTRVVMADDVSGFADPEFWGENNIIEPDKSIENAIEKIRKNLQEN